MQLKETVALVTGGASGLGRATAEAIVRGGGQVLVVDLPDKGGESFCESLGGQSQFAAADVTEADEIEAALDVLESHYGRVNAVVNCAGVAMAQRTVGRHGPHDLDSFAFVLKVNTIGTFNVIRLAGKRMSENPPLDTGERGVIVNTASVAAYDGQIGQAAYSASKGAIVGMTLPIARDLARFGVRVLTIAPGVFQTPMMEMLPEEARTKLADGIPFPSRLGAPEEYASLVCHMLTNSYLNGEVVRLDGALRMSPR